MTSSNAGWLEANQAVLVSEIQRLADLLQAHGRGDAPPERPATEVSGSALGALAMAFDLTDFERDVLVLCAGIELDSRIAAVCAAAIGDPVRAYPTFGLALACLPGAHWSALRPSGPLRRYRLVEVAGGEGTPITQAPLRIDERVLHHLTGLSQLDQRLAALLEPIAAPIEPAPSQLDLGGRIATAWTAASSRDIPVIQIWGGTASDQRTIAACACAKVGLSLRSTPAEGLPVDSRELAEFLDLWSREAALTSVCLLVDSTDVDRGDHSRQSAVSRLIEGSRFPLILCGREPRPTRQRTLIGFEAAPPSAAEQRAMWSQALGANASILNGQLAQLVTQFQLSPPRMRAACAEAVGHAREGSEDLATALWQACRVQARMPLDELAQRVVTEAGWDDLVLPEAQTQTLKEIEMHVRHRSRVYDEWGFAERSGRGLGITALFAGPSGTGKTLAAEVLASRLRLDLYRIDLSQVVDKYVGETEKNLRRVFDSAQQAGSCLLFDEADALFGRRSEVKDSHDRYANIEVGYLLQRMEAYRGLAILTTNLKESLDPAFLRRIRFVVDFPFPDAPLRAEIWRRIFPRSTPTEGLDHEQLAKLEMAGGNIRNIALNSAFLAAEEQAPVGMRHLLRAAQGEGAKLGRALTQGEVGSWL
jgi:hypothetical protein